MLQTWPTKIGGAMAGGHWPNFISPLKDGAEFLGVPMTATTTACQPTCEVLVVDGWRSQFPTWWARGVVVGSDRDGKITP